MRVEFVQVLQDVLNDLAGNPAPDRGQALRPRLRRAPRASATSCRRGIKDVPGLVDLYDGHERDAPELRFVMRRDAIARLGTTPDDVDARSSTAALLGARRRAPSAATTASSASASATPTPCASTPSASCEMPFVAGEHDDHSSTPSPTPSTGTTPSLLLHEALQPLVAVTADTRAPRPRLASADEVDDDRRRGIAAARRATAS